MDADMLDQAPAPRRCPCGRSLDPGAYYCDACGRAVASPDVTRRLRLPALFTRLSREEMALLLAMLREGLAVRAADGKRLGKVVQVHVREPEVYLHVASEADLWKIWKLTTGTVGLYIPGHAITEVDDKQVLLTMDTKAAMGCTFRPSWIPPITVPDSG